MKNQLLLLMTGLLLASSATFAQQEWKELVVNGDFEGSDFSSFSILDTQDNTSRDLTADDIVVDDNDANNHCANITFSVSPYFYRFTIKLTEPLSEGDILKFSMRAKSNAEKDYSLPIEMIGTIGRIMVKTGGEWSTFTYEGVVSQELAGCQTITLKFGKLPKKSDIFYFDDISMKVKDGSAPIEFADAKVKEICVSNWDTNGDGELSYGEAAVVGGVGFVFQYNQEITSFNELQYFISLEGIGRMGFYGTSLTSIIIPNSVTEIGDDAFFNCQRLTSLTLGNSVTNIGKNAFMYCINLPTLDIPNSVESIGEYAFDGCQSLTTLTIPNSVKEIGDYAFLSCSGLTSIIVDEGNTVYDSRGNCNSIIETETNTLIQGCHNTIIPNSVTSIGKNACNGYTGMTSLVIPKGVTSIGEGAFAGCGGLTSIIVEEGNPVYDSRNNCNAIISTADNKLITGCENTVIPNEIVSIGYAAFARCGMKSISIPNGVTSIGDYAFNYCQDLASIDIPNSVTAIGYYAFIGTAWYNNQPDGLVYAGKVLIEYKGDEAMPENTEIVIEEGTLGIASFAFNFENNNFGKPSYQNSWKMKSVTLPNSLVYIGERAFASCYGLSDVYCYAKNVPTAETDAFAWLDFENATLHVPAGSVSAYQAADPWNQFKNIVEMDLSPIDGGETIDFSSNIGEGTDLNGNVVGDIYYNISAGDGSYNAAEGCIVVTTPTDDSSISGQDIFGEDFKDGFTGIVFKVPAGKGSVKVEAQTTGTMVLKVKIGNNDPIEMELEGRLKVSFPYNVTEPTYVYIYGGSNSSQARSNRAGGTDGELKLYGIEVTKEESGIDTVHSSPFGSVASHSQFIVHSYYTLDGRKLDGVPAKKGVYIVNGRKVVIK